MEPAASAFYIEDRCEGCAKASLLHPVRVLFCPVDFKKKYRSVLYPGCMDCESLVRRLLLGGTGLLAGLAVLLLAYLMEACSRALGN